MNPINQLIPCPICSNTNLKVELNSYDNTYFIRCCYICLFSQDSEKLAIAKWNDMNYKKDYDTTLAKLNQVFNEYVKMRIDISGSMGNLSPARRKEVAVHEILTELGWEPF